MSEFLYLYRGGTTSGTPQQMQTQMQRWATWLRDLAEKGHMKDQGNPLETGGKLVKSKKTVTDGPFAEAKDLICGYTLVTAKDLAEATELSKGCPILEVEGAVEVRPVMKM